MSNAVIYVRVSTKEQTKNYSLTSQEHACRDYCERSGFAVIKVFREQGESAKTADRTELGKLLDYCTTKRTTSTTSSFITSIVSREARRTTNNSGRFCENTTSFSRASPRALTRALKG